jgi:transposase-like protein
MSKRSQRDVAVLAERAYRLLESGMSSAEVAKELQVSTRTLNRWKNRPRLLPLTLSEQNSHVDDNSQIEVVETDGDFEKQAFRKFTLNYKSASKLERLIPIALNQLEAILNNPHTRTSDRLRACQIIGDWSGLNGGLDGSMRRVFAGGYDIVAPHNPDLKELYEQPVLGRSRYAEPSLETD